MKTVVVLACLVAAALALPADSYNSKYDNFNGSEIAENIRLLKSYGKCMVDKGPCTAEGTDIKGVIPEAIETKCAKCSPKQREQIRIVINAWKTKLPELWEEMLKKYDANGDHKEDIETFINGTD